MGSRWAVAMWGAASLIVALAVASAWGQPAARAAGPPPGLAAVAAREPGEVARRIHGLSLSEAAGAIHVSVEADGPLAYRAFTLPVPNRLVVDFENVAYRLDRSTMPVGGPVLERIRSSLFRAAPAPVVRIVFDLQRLVPYRIEPRDRGVVVHLETANTEV
ncbi:MAG: AMIN domain-containing protein, partial [bacterium]